MALLDTLVSGVLSAVAGDKAPVLQDFLNANGGVTGLADRFQKGGAREVFASWVSTGANHHSNADNRLPISNQAA